MSDKNFADSKTSSNHVFKRRKCVTDKERQLIINYSRTMHSVTEIAALLKCSHRRISKVLREYRETESAEKSVSSNATLPAGRPELINPQTSPSVPIIKEEHPRLSNIRAASVDSSCVAQGNEPTVANHHENVSDLRQNIMPSRTTRSAQRKIFLHAEKDPFGGVKRKPARPAHSKMPVSESDERVVSSTGQILISPKMEVPEEMPQRKPGRPKRPPVKTPSVLRKEECNAYKIGLNLPKPIDSSLVQTKFLQYRTPVELIQPRTSSSALVINQSVSSSIAPNASGKSNIADSSTFGSCDPCSSFLGAINLNAIPQKKEQVEKSPNQPTVPSENPSAPKKARRKQELPSSSRRNPVLLPKSLPMEILNARIFSLLSIRFKALETCSSMQTVPVPVGISAHKNLHPRLLCSKCGLYGFTSLNDLETHIVKKHFRVNALLKCCFQKCVARFATDVDRLEHLHLKQHDTKLKKVIQMEDEHFVWLRLAISDLLNESINMSLLRLTGLDAKNFQGPRKSQGPEMRRNLSAKRANITQNERRDGMETNARQRSAQASLERRPQRQQNLTKPRTLSNAAINLDRLYQPEGVTCSKGASSSDLRMEISEPNNENNMRNEPENSSRSCVVKVGQRLINVLVTPDPAISSNNPNNKGIERPDYDTSSEQSVMKDELSLFDELADAVPGSSDHSDYLTFGNTDPAPKPENPRMENLSDRNNEHKRSEHENSVVKDEPSVIEESVSTYQNNRSDHGDYVTLTNNEPTASRKPEKQRLVNLSYRNNEHRRSETGNCVVKDEPSLIDELAVTIPSPSNYRTSNEQRANSEGVNPMRNSENISTEKAEHENSVVKDEPTLIDELTAAIPAALNDSFTSSNNELTVLSSKPKRSRKQNLYDVDADVSQLQTSMSQAVVKDEPSLIDDLASMIPGPSNHGNNLDPSNNVTATDSDDEIRIVTEPPAPKRPRPPNSGKKVGTKRLTTPQMQAIVRANELGTEKSDIAKIFDTSMWSVNRVLNEYRCQGTVKQKSGGGRKKKITPEIEQFIVHVSESGVCQTFSEAVSAVKKKFGVEICRQTINRFLNEYRSADLPNPKRSRKQNLYDVDGDDDRGSLRMQDDDLKIILPKERKQRKDWKHTTTSVRRAVVNAGNEGLPQQKIARIFDISAKTVGGILKRWKTDGTVERKPTTGRERKVNKVVEQFVLNIVKEDPFKSAAEIKSEILKKFNLTISHHTTCRILSRYNSLKRTTQKDLSQSKPS
ncbi:hypothetical protein DdX_18526 [Ditylenchus destructor]|uniref:Uncharacterized protein n=1 Tax=Ditylenchus destructor TaxID=166010 RepID=A0AAD4QY74_9BILA|nr:hypothetical protein DdX_18526 [Ditylenchus destructor]